MSFDFLKASVRAGCTATLGLTWIMAAACGASDDDAGMQNAAGGAGTGGTGGAATGGSSGDAGTVIDSGPAGMAGAAGAGGQGGSGANFVANRTVAAVHASPDLFPFRLCIEVNGTYLNEYPFPHGVQHQLPESNFPGIAAGGIVDLAPLLDEIGTPSTVNLHAVNARSERVAKTVPEFNDEECSDLFEPGKALAPEHVVTFENVALDQLATSPIQVLAFTGCGVHDPADPPVSANQCGQNYDPSLGNRKVEPIGFDPRLVSEPMTTQIYAVHLSPYLSALSADDLELRIGALNPDAGAMSVVPEVPATNPGYGSGELTPPAELADYATHGVTLVATMSTGEQQTLLQASLTDVQRITSPYSTPNEFFPGSDGFLLVLVGDASAESEPWLDAPGQWNDAYDGRGLHVLALPFDFFYQPD